MCGSICACHGRSPISPEGGAGRWGGRWAGFGERVARPLASQMRVIRAIILIANDYQNRSQSIPPFPNVEIYIGLPSLGEIVTLYCNKSHGQICATYMRDMQSWLYNGYTVLIDCECQR